MIKINENQHNLTLNTKQIISNKNATKDNKASTVYRIPELRKMINGVIHNFGQVLRTDSLRKYPHIYRNRKRKETSER